MSETRFEGFLPAGANAPAATQNPTFTGFITGSNPSSTQNGWDTPFYKTFISNYQAAMDDGSAKDYFLNRKTGIAMVDQEGTDAQGQVQKVRAGDVYDGGQLVGNIYDQYDKVKADAIMTPLMLSADEQTHGVTLDQKRAQVAQQAAGAATRQVFDEKVQAKKDEWDSGADIWAPVLGALGGVATGAAAGAVIGAPFGGVGAVPGAVVGGIAGGLGLGIAGGVGAAANRDELEDMAARGAVQAEMADKEGYAGGAIRLQTAAQLLGEFTNPLKQVVHGAYDTEQGDDRSGFYGTNPDDTLKRDAVATGLDVAAGLGGAALQFASPLGALTFQGQMLGQIGGKAGALALSGGKSFDERTGTFDNIFTDREGRFNLGTAAAGIGDIGIDVLQLGMGRGLMQVAGTLGKEGGTLGRLAGSGTRANVKTEAGMRFTLNDAGEAIGHRAAVSILAPSELVQAMGVHASALLAKSGKGALTHDDLYRAAVNMANGSNVRKAMLVNAFGEGGEEALQAVLEPVSHQQDFTLDEVANAGLMGAAMGAGMTAGSRIGTRSQETRLFNQARVFNEAWGRPELTREAWNAMGQAERASMLAVSPEVVKAQTALANQVAQRAVQDFLVSPDGVAAERLVDAQHEAKARELTNLNDVVDGTYVISKAQHNIDDHMVVASVNTVSDLLARNVLGLTEQMNSATDPAEKQDISQVLATATLLADRAMKVKTAFYDENTTPDQQSRLVRMLNEELQQVYDIPDSQDYGKVQQAKAATLTFLRNPADNDGSFQGLLPQVSLENSRRTADGFLQLSMGPVQAMGADFDGDKVTLAARVVSDGDLFRNMRTGNNLLGAMQDTQVNILDRAFEKAEIAELGAALRMPSGHPVRLNAEATISNLRDFLDDTLVLNGQPFAKPLITGFIRDLRHGDPKAKVRLMNKLATQLPGEMQELADRTLSNVWFKINSRLHRELQAFQFSRAASSTTTATAHHVAPIEAASEIGTIRAQSAATYTQSLSFESIGSDLFRKWQSLSYSKFNSPELDSSVEDPTTLQEMTAFYAALSSGKADSDFAALFTKDPITKQVVEQLLTLAGLVSNDFNGRRPSMLLLANTLVPNLQKDGRFGQKPTTLLQWLLGKAVDADEQKMRASGVYDAEPSLSAKYSRLRSANPGQAFAEVFEAYQMRDLLGQDGDVFGANVTVGQWLASYVNQSDFHRQEDARALRMHSAYLAKDHSQGRHNLPYYLDDVQNKTTPITPYQSMVDALLQAGNSTLSWNSETNRPSGRIGKTSNQTSDTFRAAIDQIQAAGALARINIKSEKAWAQLLDERPELGRAYMALIPDSAVDATYFIDTKGDIHIARWVHKLLTLPAKEAEMEYLRQTLLASWVAAGVKKDDEGAKPRSYYSMSDRLHQLMSRLAHDDRTFLYERFQRELFAAKDVDAFIGWVNNNVRDDEAPYTAWNRDVAEIDPTATMGGWQRILEGATQREAIQMLNTKAEKLIRDVNDEALRAEADDLTFQRLRDAIGNPNSESRPLLENLGRMLDFAKDYITPMGPAAMQRVNVGALLGAFGNAANKGQSASMFEVVGAYDAKGDSLKFGTAEEIFLASLTAYSTDEAGQDPTLLMTDDWSLIDGQGRPVTWSQLTPEKFVELWETPEYRPMLRAIVFPSAYEHTMAGRIDQVSLIDLSLTALVTEYGMHDVMFGKSSHSKGVYLSFVDSVAGNQAVMRYINEVAVSHTGSRLNTLESPDEAQMIVQHISDDLADVLQDLGALAQVEFPVTAPDGTELVVNSVDALREMVKERLHQLRLDAKYGSAENRAETESAFLLAQSMLNEQLGSNPSIEDAERALKLVDEMKAYSETNPVQRIVRAFTLPYTTAADWFADTELKRIDITRYVLAHPDLVSMARWATGLDKITDPATERDAATQLPKLTKKEWVDVTRAIVANEIQQNSSTTIPGLENARPGDPSNPQWLRLFDPDFEFLVNDLLDSNGPLVQSALKLHLDFHRPTRDRVLEHDVADKLIATLFSPRKLGTWDDKIAEQIRQGDDRIDASGSPQGISQGGMGPQSETVEGMATRRTVAVPEPDLRSTVTFSLKDLDRSFTDNITVMRPNGASEMPFGMLDGRFTNEVTVQLAGAPVSLLLQGEPWPGLTFADTIDSGYESITMARLKRTLERFAQQNGVSPNSLVVTMKFLHPADLPEDPEFANNVFFEGTVLNNSGDNYGSLASAWWFAPGGIDPSSSAQALGAAKKQKKALKAVERLKHAEKLALEIGWEQNFHGMLERKALRVLDADLGDGRRVEKTFFNAVLKSLKMRHLVRGLDAEGNVVVLTAEQVIARQAKGLPLDLVQPELYVLSDSALRTLLGEPGTRGELRSLTADLTPDVTKLPAWEGQITTEHLDRLPGLGVLEAGDLFKTRAARRKFQRKISPIASLDMATRNAYQRARTGEQQLASEIGQEREQKNNPKVYETAGVAAIKHAQDALGSPRDIDIARAGRNIPGAQSGELRAVVDRQILSNKQERMGLQSNATGFIYRHSLPERGQRAAFGELYGPESLQRTGPKASWVAPGDFVSIDLDSFTYGQEKELKAVLRWFMDAGAVIALTSKEGSSLRSVGSRYLRDESYSKIEGSDAIFERANPDSVPATLQARYDHLMETGGRATYNRTLFFQTKHFGLEENTGFALPAAQDQRVVGAVDLIPTSAFPNFNLPLAGDMDEIRLRLTDEALPGLVKVSEIQAKRKLTPAELKALTKAVEKAAGLNEIGLYENGDRLEIGDLIPLYNRWTKQLILYRHGHKPPRNSGELALQFKDSNTAVYGPETLPSATTHSGDIVRFDRANRYGLRVLLSIPIQAFADKTVIEGSGFKAVSIAPLDYYDSARNLRIPEGIAGMPLSYVIGLEDSLSKENYDGRVDNFREAFASLGVDFTPDVAKFFFGENYTADKLSMVQSILVALRKSLPKLSVAEVDQMMKAENLPGLYQETLTNLGFPSVFSGVVPNWAELAAEGRSPEARIVRSMVLYLMAEDAQVEHILQSSGFNNPDAKLHGLYTREMPRLFTQVFDRTQMDDPLRLHVIEKLNQRFNNVQAPAGYVMAPNFKVTIVNTNPAHTMEGYLQFAEARTSGDNPVINLMAQDRQSSQTASKQQTSMAALAANARTATTKLLDKTNARLRLQHQAQKGDGLELMRVLRAVPVEEGVSFAQTKTPAEMEYDRDAAILVDSFRQPIDTSEWDVQDKAAYREARNSLARGYGLSESQAVLVDFWVRQFLYRPKDATPEDEGGNPGKVSLKSALEVIELMEQNRQVGLLPISGAQVPLHHFYDLRQLQQAAENGGPFQLVGHLDTGRTVTSLQDWADVSLAIGDVEQERFNLLALTATDGMFHTYRNSGLGFSGLTSSLYKERAVQLLDPATSELMMSISPHRAASLHDVELVAARTTLESIFGGTREGLHWRGKMPAATAVGQSIRRQKAWHKKEGIPESMDSTVRGLQDHGIRLRTDGTVMSGFLKSALNLRASMALINPMLTIGAPLEQFIQGLLEDATNVLTGDAITSRIPGSSEQTAQQARDFRLLIDALGHNQKMKSMLFSEFGMDEPLYNAGPIETFTHRMAKFGGQMQDPYYKMRGNTIARRYVESAVRAFRTLGTATNITAMQVLREMSANPQWVKLNHPAVHEMAMNTVREMKNMKDTTIGLAWRGFLEPLTTSSHLLVSTASTVGLKLPFMFAGYTMNKAVQLLGLQGYDAAFALLLHGRQKGPGGILGRLQAAAAGRPFTEEEGTFDMSSVIESVDLTSAFIKSGLTHSGLMAMGLMVGNLGLSGEDEEDRRRRKAARLKGFAYLYDPRDIVNDFRNADAIYLDWLPFGLDEMFRVTDPNDVGGSRSMVNMNWLLRQVFSPIIGMERFFNTGNPWEIWWGFEDAFYSFPLINTTLVSDAQRVFSELASSALQEEAKGTPESMPAAFNYWVKAVMGLERMLLENSFINMLYQASDKYDRDSWVMPEHDAQGNIVRNKLGNNEPTSAMVDYVGEDGQVHQSYKGRDWMDATLHGFAENRATFAVLGSLFEAATGGDGMLRGDMPIKTRKIAKDEITKEIAEAHLVSLYKGVLKPGDPVLEQIYIPLEMRNEIGNDFKKALVDEGLAIGLTQAKAESRMWTIWKGDPLNTTVKPLKDIVYSKDVSYSPSSRYYQLNTTYVMGPDGKMWATGLDKHNLLNLAGIAPLQRYITTENDSQGVDGRLNYTDRARNLNSGMRGLEKIDESFAIPSDAATQAAAASTGSYTPNSYTPYQWQDWGSNGSGRQNYGSGGGGGGGGVFTRLNAPQDQQVPYANDVQNINVNTPIIRRASIRRERIESQKGRLKPWQ